MKHLLYLATGIFVLSIIFVVLTGVTWLTIEFGWVPIIGVILVTAFSYIIGRDVYEKIFPDKDLRL